MKRAFGATDRNNLDEKPIDIEVTVQKWFASYFCRSCQLVKYKNKISNDLLIDPGLPQGIVLGPILFSLYIYVIIYK